MTNTEFIRELAAEMNITISSAKEIAKAYEKIVYRHSRDDGGVKLMNGLVIATKHVDARMGHNPATGEPVAIPAKIKPVAKFGKAFKDAVNE